MVKIGIVGHCGEKFTEETKAKSIQLIYSILSSQKDAILISGHSPAEGIDVWAEEVAKNLRLQIELKIAEENVWYGEHGNRKKFIDIARSSDDIHVIVVEKYPPNYTHRKYKKCIHCLGARSAHVKSGTCWLGIYARKLKKRVQWHIIRTDQTST
jgi:hypothetical protein